MRFGLKKHHCRECIYGPRSVLQLVSSLLEQCGQRENLNATLLYIIYSGPILVAQMVKNLPAMQETRV